jgi:hypothetical protein
MKAALYYIRIRFNPMRIFALAILIAPMPTQGFTKVELQTAASEAAKILNPDFEMGNLSGWRDWSARRAEISDKSQVGRYAVALGPESGQCAQEVKSRPTADTAYPLTRGKPNANQ